MRRLLLAVAAFTALTAAPRLVPSVAAQEGIAGVVAAGAKAELVQDGFQFTEGPVWSPEGFLLFTDNRASRIYRLGADGKATVYRENTLGMNGLAFDRKGRLLACEGGGARIVAVARDGTVTSLASRYREQPLVRPNDLIANRSGGVYFTDPGPRPAPDQVAARKPAVYYVPPEGEVQLVTEEIARPNGITLTLDEKTLLVADTRGEHVAAFDVRPDGSTTNRRNFTRLSGVQRTEGGIQSGADGMTLDSEGRLYVTTLSGIQVFDRAGHSLGTISVPNKPSNLAFGGADRRTLYITAGDSLFRLSMQSRGAEGRAK